MGTLRASAHPARTPKHAAERIAWAIRVAARRAPFAHNCLTQALTACFLLRRDGHPAALRVGVTRDANARFTAHAWVESGGRVLVGAPEHQGYVPLPSWESIS